MNAQDAWRVAYSQLEIQLDRATFETWLKGATFLDHTDGVFTIGVKNNYARDMLKSRLYRNVRRVLMDVVNAPVEIDFVVHQPTRADLGVSSPQDMPLFRFLEEQQQPRSPYEDLSPESLRALHEVIQRPSMHDIPDSGLIAHYTFDRFVVANSNRYAYNAARAVVDAPGRNYNPCLIYSSTGLGKTHLLNAIGHAYRAKGLRTTFVTSESFVNDMMEALRQKTMAMFRDKYRSSDVLLIDDIHFISGKESTQEEFFHTFNTLHRFGKQIVMTSDRHPREFSLLEDRLRSRFEGGLLVDITPLEYETRIAILRMWAEEQGVKVSMPVMEVIAQGVHQDGVRELEGAFMKLVMQTRTLHRPLTVTEAQTLLLRFDAPRAYGAQVDARDILQAVTRYFNLRNGELTGKARTARVNHARQVAMYLCRENTELSLPQIGDLFGGRSHTTVLHGCNKMSESLADDPMLQQQLKDLKRALFGD